MNLTEFIIRYGYGIIFAGTFLEGETILVLGGFLAHRGYLNIAFVIVSAFLGSLLGDQIYFLLGKYKGNNVLLKHPNWKSKIGKFNAYLGKYSVFIVLIFRFLYGLRTVAPFAIGLSGMSNIKFLVFNAISACLWAVAVGMAGYLFGHTVEIILGDLRKIELVVIIPLFVIFIAVLAVRFCRKRRNRAR